MALVLLLVALALLTLLRLYAASYFSLVDYAYASERPQFTVQSVRVSQGGVQVLVENSGGIPVRVEAAYALTYSGGVPAGAVACPNVSDLYLPPSASFTCTLPSSYTYELMGPGRPLRLEIVTDRGPALVGAPAPIGTLVVDVAMPRWLAGVVEGTPWDVSEFAVNIWCPASLASQGAPPTVTLDVEYLNSTPGGDRYAVVPDLLAGECKLELVYRGPYRELLGFSSPGSPLGAEEGEDVSLVMDQVVYLPPGKTLTVSFDMPEVYASGSTIQAPTVQFGAILYDFSWYYYPALTGGANVQVKGFEGSSAYVPGVLAVADSLLQRGAIYASSPQACPIESISASQAFEYGAETFWGSFALDNGIPIVAGPCAPSPFEPALTVKVPVLLPEGQHPTTYLVLAILGAYISGGGKGRVVVDGNTYAFNGSAQVVAQSLVYVPAASSGAGGAVEYNVTADLYVTGYSSSVYAVITVSKIVALPVGPSGFCEYLVNDLPTLPYALANLQTGTIERIAPVILNYAISSKYFNSESQWQNYSFLFYNSTSKEVVLRELYVTYNDVKLVGVNENFTENLAGQNATPYYVQNASYSVSIGAQVNPNASLDSGDLGGLYAYSGPYTPYSGTLYPSLSSLYSGYYQQAIASSQSWAFVLDYNPGISTPTANMTINVTAQPGDYVVLGLMFTAPNGMRVAPTISVSGGAIVYEPNFTELVNSGVAYAEAPVIIQMSGSAASITISPPLNGQGSGMVGLVNLAVYDQVLGSQGYQKVYWNISAPVGLDLENVRSPTGSVDVEIADAENGALLAIWNITNVPSSYSANYVLSIDGFERVSAWDWSLPYLQQEVPYLLLVYGAYCSG